MKYPYLESRVSELTGLSITALRVFRKRFLTRKQWRKGKGQGRPVEWTQGALVAVCDSFKIYLDDVLEKIDRSIPIIPNYPSRNSEIRAFSDFPKEVKVSRICENMYRLECRNGTNEMFEVVVPDNQKFTVGDPVRIKQGPHPLYYELDSKPPRHRGDSMYKAANGFK